jgi:hypothetical protein
MEGGFLIVATRSEDETEIRSDKAPAEQVLGGALADLTAVKDAVVKADERPSRHFCRISASRRLSLARLSIALSA